MPKKNAIQRKREREKKEAIKLRKAAERQERARREQENPNEVALKKRQQAAERREKTRAFNTVSEQNLELASQVFSNNFLLSNFTFSALTTRFFRLPIRDEASLSSWYFAR